MHQSLRQQLRQLGDIRRNPARLIARERLGSRVLFALPAARRDGCRPSRRSNDNQKGIGKLLESSLPRCPKATTVAWKQENAFARQIVATIAKTDGRGSFWQNLGPAGKHPRDRREQEHY